MKFSRGVFDTKVINCKLSSMSIDTLEIVAVCDEEESTSPEADVVVSANSYSEHPMHLLVRLAQDGDHSAFGELVIRYEGMVHSIAFRVLGDAHLAEDLSQDVFLQAFRKLDQLREPKAFGGWLGSITRRLAINKVTRGRRGYSILDNDNYPLEDHRYEQPPDHSLRLEMERNVTEGISRLREMDRQTLSAFYFDGKSILDMHDEFDTPAGTIKRRLHVARKRLANEIKWLIED